MPQVRGSLGFFDEAPFEVGVVQVLFAKELDRDLLARQAVRRCVDDADAARADTRSI
jgi:hypothetical protein